LRILPGQQQIVILCKSICAASKIEYNYDEKTLHSFSIFMRPRSLYITLLQGKIVVTFAFACFKISNLTLNYKLSL
jgi:hypothetical protein